MAWSLGALHGWASLVGWLELKYVWTGVIPGLSSWRAGRTTETKVGAMQRGPGVSMQEGALAGHPKAELGTTQGWGGTSQGSLHRGNPSRTAVA